MYYGKDAPCFRCEHFCSNNYDRLGCGCRAFPDGIPYGFRCEQHTEVVEGQVGDYVFKQLSDDAQTPFREYVAYMKKHM